MARAAGEEGCALRRAVSLPFSEIRPGGSGAVALGLEVALKVLTPDLYVAPELYGGYLPTLYPPVDPRFAHPKLLADVRNREQIEVSSCCCFCSWLGLGALRTLISAYEGLFKLYKRAL